MKPFLQALLFEVASMTCVSADAMSKSSRLRWLHMAHCCTCKAPPGGLTLWHVSMCLRKDCLFVPVVAAWYPVRSTVHLPSLLTLSGNLQSPHVLVMLTLACRQLCTHMYHLYDSIEGLLAGRWLGHCLWSQ